VTVLERILKRLGFGSGSRKEDADISRMQAEVERTTISAKLHVNEQRIRDIYGNSADLILRTVDIGVNPGVKALVVGIDGLIDKTLLSEGVVEKLTWRDEVTRISGQRLFETAKQRLITIGDVIEIKGMSQLADHVNCGDCAVLIEGNTHALACSIRGWAERNVEEPTSESVIRGPKEGFTETLRTNTALIRRRIKTPWLRVEQLKVGALSKTDVAVLYIKGVVNDKVVEEVRRRLERIDTDSIIGSGYIEELIEDAPYSPFPTILRTERPDKFAGNLFEGRVGLIIDGTPFALIVPATFTMFLTASEDYYSRYFIGSAIRFIRFLSFFISLTLPSLYVSATTFHQEMLPTPLILSIAAQREGVPFPAFVEALIMEVAFEILREASIRLPKIIGPAISILGVLIIGEAAVEAGIVSPIMVIIVAGTGIASFATPVFSLAIGIRMIRFPMMVLAGVLGVYGVFMGMSALLLHLAALRSFGTPFLEPLAPVIFSDIKDVLVRAPWWATRTRPRLVGKNDPVRQNRGLIPRPSAEDEK